MKKFFHSLPFKLSLRFSILLSIITLIFSVVFTLTVSYMLRSQKSEDLENCCDEISKALEHIFEKCGFSKMGEDSEYYAVSMEYLRNQAVKKNIVPEEMLWLWEHR